MRFVMIETPSGTQIAVNPNNINKIDLAADVVYLGLTGGSMVPTKFTDIAHAIDYIQRASSISLTQGG